MIQNRSALALICLFIGTITLSYYLFLRCLPGGGHFGVILVGLHSLVFLFFGFVFLHADATIIRRYRRFFQVTGFLFICWLGSVFAVSMLLMMHAKTDLIKDPDYLVILGAGLQGDKPSATLSERLAVGASYLQSHSDLPVVVTGGQGPGESISEAEAMKSYLIALGVAEHRIITEEQSQSTMENFLFTRKVLEQTNTSPPVKIVIVTSNFHLFRSKILAERNGFISGSIAAPTPIYLLPANLLREYAAIVKSMILDHQGA